jgi:hypothetical protein
MVLLAPAAASAATTGDTTVTFTVTAGTLDITVPATVDLGSTAPGGTVSAPLGAVTVTDTRGASPATWTTTVTSTDYTTGAATAAETVPTANVTYWSGPTTASNPAIGFTPGQPTAGDAVALTAGQTAFSFSGAGGNTATWNPTLTIAVPATAVAGTYSGTVTHSVAP